MKSILFLFLLIFTSCTLSDRRMQERKSYYEQHLEQLTDSLSNLSVEHEESKNYLVTAETHQVTRSPDEKERQIKNLNDYQVELEFKIKSVESLINHYKDSISLLPINQY